MNENTALVISDDDFYNLRTFMKSRFGINLEKKRVLCEGRLRHPFSVSGFATFHEYLEDILSDQSGKKVEELVIRLTTNYTYFMREEEHYRFLTEVALPEWTEKIKDHDLRIWSAGCSSGEEPYTTAMVLDQYFGSRKSAWETTVLATDVSLSALNKAKAGIYPQGSLERIDPSWRKKYFDMLKDGNCKVKEILRKEVVFSQFNLMQEFTRFKKRFHIIFCRNVMIYFDNPTKAALAARFSGVLEQGGFLIIGQSETLSGIYGGLTQVYPSIYKKVSRL